jgi:hypothetical protein
MSVSKWVSDETTAKYKPKCEWITSNPLRGMDECMDEWMDECMNGWMNG